MLGYADFNVIFVGCKQKNATPEMENRYEALRVKFFRFASNSAESVQGYKKGFVLRLSLQFDLM